MHADMQNTKLTLCKIKGRMLKILSAGLILLLCLTKGDAAITLQLDHADHGETFSIKNEDGTVVLSGNIGRNLASTDNLHATQDGSCINFSSSGTKVTEVLEDCINLGDAHWYGGPEEYRQYLPIDNVTISESSYVSKSDDYQSIAEPFWLSSKGVYIYVEQGVPLFIDMNHHVDRTLCLIAKSSAPYLTTELPQLKYRACAFDNAREARMNAVQTVLGKPQGYPDERMITHPIWSTWARYKQNIDETTVLNFANEILSHGFNNSQLEIDDGWETCYGSHTFTETKFPKPKDLTDKLKSMGFRVTVWAHPFINTGCDPWFTEATNNGYFVYNDASGNTLTTWWDGSGGIIDFTNSKASQWLISRLKSLQEDAGINGFKFDAGETSYLPQPPRLDSTSYPYPGVFTKSYVNAASTFGSMIEVRVAERSQNLPIFVRMGDKDSRWDFNNGLKTVVTVLLEMNMVGYPFILPDMVGGNGYAGAPTKELFIRWLQANVFMPAIQYSYVPWDYDDETLEICKKYTALHAQYAGEIIRLAAKAVNDGTPINLPIWWIDPSDATAQTISSEYLLGETILVAPILDEGAVSRDIYLPKGQWHDELRNENISGPRWLRNYSVSLSELAYFTRVQ